MECAQEDLNQALRFFRSDAPDVSSKELLLETPERQSSAARRLPLQAPQAELVQQGHRGERGAWEWEQKGEQGARRVGARGCDVRWVLGGGMRRGDQAAGKPEMAARRQGVTGKGSYWS